MFASSFYELLTLWQKVGAEKLESLGVKKVAED